MAFGTAIALGVVGGGTAMQVMKLKDRYDEDKAMTKTKRKRPCNDLKYLHEFLALLVAYVYARSKGKNLDIQLGSWGYELLDGNAGYDAPIPFARTEDLRWMVFKRLGHRPDKGNALLRVEDDKPVRWPEYIVAIRGTVLSEPKDLRDDLIITAELMSTRNSIKRVVKILSDLHQKAPDPDGVCVAGHSLGAFIGLVATAQLATQGKVLNAHLFNPPNISLGILAKKLVKGTMHGVADGALLIPVVGPILRSGIRGTCSLAVKGVKAALRITGEKFAPLTYDEAAKRYKALQDQGYLPHMYVNPADFVCNEYGEHFQNGSPGVSISVPFVKVFASGASSGHLIPQAYVHTNQWAVGPWNAHKIDQWWRYEPVNLKSELVGR